MFQVKICGITSEEDALAAVQLGADAIGLNFFPPSRRYVTPDEARKIAATVSGRAAKVGVFVNADIRTIEGTALNVPLDFIQLHGDESPEMIRELQPRQIIRAYRYSKDRVTELGDDLGRCRDLSASPVAVLLDAFHPAEFGGTGITMDWVSAGKLRDLLGGLPFILAGGLTPDNVAEAIGHAHPDAVDVASGVESDPRRKDELLMGNFIRIARQTLAREWRE